MRAAAALLSAARTVHGMADVVRAAGLGADSMELGRAERVALGVEDMEAVRIAAGSGPGATRVLIGQMNAVDLRQSIQQLAGRLASRAPHVLWFLAVVQADGQQAVIVAIGGGSRKLSAFAWEPGMVVDSDAETLCAVAALRHDVDELHHARCSELLGRDALTRRFYRALDARVTALAACRPPTTDMDDARGVALLYASRLLFLCFVQAKGWLDGDRAFLSARFDECMRSGGGYHQRVLLPLFFGTLNTPPRRRAAAARAFGAVPFLNGGLFTRTSLERRIGGWRFSDEALGALLDGVFQRFRFVAREDSATWSEAAVDPEMLGRTFESLMAPPARKAGGVFYTPHHLVARVADEALDVIRQERSLSPLDALRGIRVLDPACGSGAFLVHTLERLAEERRRAGDSAAVSAIRRDVLARSIFGVDRDPTAVWLCELRLWLSVVIDSDAGDASSVAPLPNLDRNIRLGDALSGAPFTRELAAVPGGRVIARLRERYVRATGSRKLSLARALDREERRRALGHADRLLAAALHARREHVAARRTRDLFGARVHDPGSRRESRRLRDLIRSLRVERRRVADGGALPFSFGAFFPEAEAAGGFDAIVGNPPWVRLHRIPAAARARLRERYEVFRHAAWAAGAADGGASRGFASQVDLAALFVERSLSLLRPGGALSLLLPVKLWRSLAGGGVRRLLERVDLRRVEDLSASRHAFDAAVYPSLVVARADAPRSSRLTIAVHDHEAWQEWDVPREALPFDGSPGAPWLLLPPPARAAFERLRRAGPALATVFGPPRLGVKTSCNAAFVVRLHGMTRTLADIADSNGEHGKIEREMLRPALRGDGVTAWLPRTDDWIVWTHDQRGPLPRLPEHARRWLRRKYTDLVDRRDAARSRRWWSLFRVDAADASGPRVVWADFGRRPRALVLPAGDPIVPLNTCYVLRCQDECDAWALATLLNSPVAAAWLNALAEPARGGYRRYMSWTVAQLPIPDDWARARLVLARAAQDARGQDAWDDRLLDATMDAYALRRGDLAALTSQLP